MAIAGVKNLHNQTFFLHNISMIFWKLRETAHQRPQNQRFNLPPLGNAPRHGPSAFQKAQAWVCSRTLLEDISIIKNFQRFRISMLPPQPKLLPLLWQWQHAPKPASQCQAIPLKTKTLTNTLLGCINQKGIYRWMMSILYFDFGTKIYLGFALSNLQIPLAYWNLIVVSRYPRLLGGLQIYSKWFGPSGLENQETQP